MLLGAINGHLHNKFNDMFAESHFAVNWKHLLKLQQAFGKSFAHIKTVISIFFIGPTKLHVGRPQTSCEISIRFNCNRFWHLQKKIDVAGRQG